MPTTATTPARKPRALRLYTAAAVATPLTGCMALGSVLALGGLPALGGTLCCVPGVLEAWAVNALYKRVAARRAR